MNEETLLSQNNNTDGSRDLEESSRVSSILIGILLIVAVFLAFNFFQGTPEDSLNEETSSQPTPVLLEGTDDNPTSETGAPETGEGTYTVQAGDTLWSIAESQLNDGFRWEEIAVANKISNSSELTVGAKLVIPVGTVGSINGEKTAVTPTPTTSGTVDKPSDTVTVDEVYTVKAGDTLWDIAVEYYGDGTQWHRIFDDAQNDISMYTPQSGGSAYPLIHAGNVLVIPALAN